MQDDVSAPAPAVPVALLTGQRHVLASAVMLGGVTGLVKLVAFVKDLLVARRFGAGDELDAYLVAFMLPSYAVSVLANTFASAFVPTYIRVSQQHGTAAAARLAGASLAGILVMLSIVTLLLAAGSHYLLPLVGIGFDQAKIALAARMFYLLLGIVLASGVSAVFAALLNAHEHFAIPALAPVMIPLTTTVAFWLFQDRFGIDALAVGTLAGFVLEAVVLGAGASYYRLLAWPGSSVFGGELAHVGSQYFHVAVGLLLMASSTVVDQAMAASLGPGNVSILNYGNKIVALVLNMVAVSLSTVLFPRFARMIAGGTWDDLIHTMRTYARMIVLVSIPGVALLAIVSEPLVRLFWERGAFTSQDTQAVSAVQICLALQIPFYILAMLGARVLSALDGNQLILRIGALNLAVNVVGDYVLMQWFGVKGIGLATSLVYVVAAAATFWAIKNRLAEVRARAGNT